jgi:hypothetical protein
MGMRKRSCNIFNAKLCFHQIDFTQHFCYLAMMMLCFACFNIQATAQLTGTNNEVKSKTMKAAAEDTLSHNIFRAFQKGSDSLWVLLYPTNAEYRELTRLMTEAKIIKLPQEDIDQMLIRHDNEATAAYKDIFHAFLRQADSLGIKWNEASYQKLDFTSLYPEDFIRKYMNGDIWFSCKKLNFIIEGIEAVEVSGGFKLQSIKSIRQVDSIQ